MRRLRRRPTRPREPFRQRRHGSSGVRCGGQSGSRSVVQDIFADEVVAIPASLAMRAFIADRRGVEFLRLVASRRQPGLQTAEPSPVGVVRVDEQQWSPQAAARHRRTSQRDDWLLRSLGHHSLRLTDDERIRLIARLDAMAERSEHGDTAWSTRHRLFDGGYAAAGLERYDRSAADCSLESRSPFMDRRVVEFFQSLPAEQLVAGGWSKSILRRSMAEQLPQPVVWNRDKPHLGPEFREVWDRARPNGVATTCAQPESDR